MALIDNDETKEWRNLARKCQRVRAGDRISVQVQGGWVSKQAPWDGYVIESGGNQLYLPDSVLRKRKSK